MYSNDGLHNYKIVGISFYQSTYADYIYHYVDKRLTLLKRNFLQSYLTCIPGKLGIELFWQFGSPFSKLTSKNLLNFFHVYDDTVLPIVIF